MASLVIPNTVEMRLVYTNGGADYAVNVLHYDAPTSFGVDAGSVATIAAAVAVAWDTGAISQRDLTADNVSLSRVGLRDLRSPNLPLLESAVNVAGLAANDPMPQQTACCVTLRTALAGRSYRGRVYLPGYAEGQNDSNGNPVANVRTAAVNFMTDMMSLSQGANTLLLGVASKTLLETNIVTSVEVRDLVWDTQRRRLHGGI